MKRIYKISSIFQNLILGSEPELVINFETAEIAANAYNSSDLANSSLKCTPTNNLSKEMEQFNTECTKKHISRYLYIAGSEKQLQKKDVHEFYKDCGRIVNLEIRQRGPSTTVYIQFDSLKSSYSAFRMTRLRNLGLIPIKVFLIKAYFYTIF